jgi:hypothetical protein
MSQSPQPSATSAPAATADTDPYAEERADLLEALHHHRGLLLHTVAGLTDEQAAGCPTASELCLGGIIKHVAATEAEWTRFVVEGAESQPDTLDWDSIDWSNPPPAVVAYQNQFRMTEGETLEGILARYAEVAAATDARVAEVDLSLRQLLPAAPWFEPGATWSSRRTFSHILAEITQHAGHADILRETIDGQKSMG